jgi:hypothetical protein
VNLFPAVNQWKQTSHVLLKYNVEAGRQGVPFWNEVKERIIVPKKPNPKPSKTSSMRSSYCLFIYSYVCTLFGPSLHEILRIIWTYCGMSLDNTLPQISNILPQCMCSVRLNKLVIWRVSDNLNWPMTHLAHKVQILNHLIECDGCHTIQPLMYLLSTWQRVGGHILNYLFNKQNQSNRMCPLCRLVCSYSNIVTLFCF